MGIIVKWAELSKGYYYGEFLQHKPGLGCEITGDTTEDEALDMLEKLLDKWHTKKTSGTPFEALKPQPWTAATITADPQIIQLREQPSGDALTAIQSAPTLEELKTYKTLAASDPTKELYTAYCKRLKELNDNNKQD